MKMEAWKILACKLLGTVSVLFLFGLVAAIVEGSIFWPVGLALALANLLLLNSICGVLLPEEESKAKAGPPLSSTFRVVLGGKAA